MPGEIVAEIAAQRGADHRGHHHGDAIHGKTLAALLGREGRGEDRLRDRRHAASREALKDTEEKKGVEVPSEAAKHRTHREQGEADHEKPLAAKHHRDPAAGAKHDGIGHQIGRDHPGSLVGADREAARDVAQRHVGDGGVEHFHEGRDRHDGGDDPRVDPLHLARPLALFGRFGGLGRLRPLGC